AAAGRRQQQQQPQQNQQQPSHGAATHFGSVGGCQPMMHPAAAAAAAAAAAMYQQRAAPYPGQQEMRFQPQFAATAAMPQYAAYAGGLPADMHVADMYRNAQAPQPQPHHLPYRGAPMDIPRGSYLVPAPAPGYLAAPGPHGLGYYRQRPLHQRRHRPPPPQQPKESILESLLAARSERLSAASMEAEEASLPKSGENGGPSASPHAPKGRQHDGGVHHPKAMSDRNSSSGGGGVDTPKKTGGNHEAQAVKGGAGGGGGGAGAKKKANGGCAATDSPRSATTSPQANVSAAVAMHLTGLPQGGGFPGMSGGLPHLGLHHGIGTMRGVGGLRGMPPPTAVTVPPAAGGPQEKKLQKRAANRKSAQLSRKRKKALIEELRYENQDLQRHEDILEVIPDPVFAFDTTNGRVWFASTSASAQFGLSVEDLTSACFFDLMTEDCSKRLKVLIDTAAKDVSETNSALLHERMTVRFKKRRGAILLGELSGRLSRLNGVMTAVCSVRPLSLATDEIVGKVSILRQP
ncbi:unnamed protein product, partial [Scytosiphon promiscuus]